jgi:hypothetical protein
MGMVSGWLGSRLARYLTAEVHQHGSAPSTWSHAALYVGNEALPHSHSGRGNCFIEADVVEGVRSVGAELFEVHHTRICRPVGLTEQETQLWVDYAVARLGH